MAQLAFSVKQIDPWFFQEDVHREFVAFPELSGGLFRIFESRESYVEFLYSHCVPIPASRFPRTLEDVSWGMDINRSRALIARRTAAHFLSRAFRNRAGLELGRRTYRTTEGGRVVARRELTEGPSHRYDRILVAGDLVRQFLRQTSQRLLWCVRSIRYSERTLGEFGVEPYEVRVHDDTRHYLRQAAHFTSGRSYDRPRMQSLTQLFGKRAVPEIDRYA